jgi:iron complex outermembrane receptor protein
MIKNTFIILLVSLPLFAQGLFLRGRVLDASHKTPLVSASVILKPSQSGALSDSKGYFEIRMKMTRDSNLQVSYVGYETVVIPLNEKTNTDSLQIILHRVALPSQSILVSASAMESDSRKPNYQKVERSDLEKIRANEDVPELLSSLPSTQWYSEGGAGNGYNYLSIRGFDQRRIAVMVNGIPQNDPEDHNVYWIDFSDILGSSEVIKVQRGSGGGIFGYPAIGGAINIVTSSVTEKPEFRFGMQDGSYGLRKYLASYSTGLIDGKYSVQARFAQTHSTGYRDYSATNVNSYYLSVARFDDNLVTQVNFYGGPFEDQLVYTGLPKSYIADKNLRKLNYSDWDMGPDGYVVPRRAEENEQFTQPHYEILQDWKLSNNVTLNSALFYVIGSGYYDYDGSWANYSYFRLTPQNGFTVSGSPDDNYIANAIIRAQVENKQWGWMPRLKIKLDNQELNAGLEVRFHRSNHWGSLISGNGAPPEVTPNFHYYDYNAGKDMLGAFVNDSYSLSNAVKISGELQLSYTKYLIYDEKFIGTNFTVPNLFLNPKIGINYTLSDVSSLFFTTSIVSREPRLSNYYDAGEASGSATPQFEQRADGSYDFSKPYVKPERMLDFELGYGYSTDEFVGSINLYLMSFKDEIVKDGGVDRFGEPTTGNMNKTRHIGAEFSLRYAVNKCFDLVGNATFSKSTVVAGTFYKTLSTVTYAVDLAGDRITASPDFLGNFGITFHSHGAYIEFTGNYVSSFYSDNLDTKAKTAYSEGLISYDDNKNDAYFTAKFLASYSFQLERFSGETKIYGQVNNIFDKLYSAYAVGKEFFPAAERNFVFGIITSL